MDFQIPSQDVLARWRKGSPVTDEELAVLEAFFRAMTSGCDALGTSYILVTSALYVEHVRACRTVRYRREAR